MIGTLIMKVRPQMAVLGLIRISRILLGNLIDQCSGTVHGSSIRLTAFLRTALYTQMKMNRSGGIRQCCEAVHGSPLLPTAALVTASWMIRQTALSTAKTSGLGLSVPSTPKQGEFWRSTGQKMGVCKNSGSVARIFGSKTGNL
ncbi:hypothetical protein AVDCRST_MAG94-1930 [uncultured Leptolyngbya sp.]|uniref:Uncharacterized protein n=2 Tax=Cyanophyceae TaxID=3028117 RepID=A0A6J4LEC1_9CYAN|nr:hypothetical protein AVDCRST_MAG94-1930 [uncultured Leptolyngbya sp.]CAA9587032.1 hypothetical protein AVDCRST_MAG81-3988 [uncultured Synechococcales cyanobacterium]